MKYIRLAVLLSALFPQLANSKTLEVGAGKQFSRLQAACALATQGDTILLHDGVYSGGDYIENLKGATDAWIVIRAASTGTVIFRGGSSAFHLTDPAYLIIEGLIFEQQTGNGLNIDDGGSYDSPAHDLIIQNCEWRSMNATGNNDELKMSGVDDFTVRKSIFLNGASGGSLIDMVGCHRGLFTENYFENGGSNSIQAKGATSSITISRNRFVNGGLRALNIGGSTGLQFFRPLGATYEADSIWVYSNVFVGSQAPIAFVGAINCEVINNTIVNPEKWVVRILQESVEGFQPCGDNAFRNNIVVLNNASAPFNVGSNTAPETFTISHNLWYLSTNPNWSGPNTPTSEPGRIVNRDPLFIDTLYRLSGSSPAFEAGIDLERPRLDYLGLPFSSPRSIGALQATGVANVTTGNTVQLHIYYDPLTREIVFASNVRLNEPTMVYDINGRMSWIGVLNEKRSIGVGGWVPGVYFLCANDRTTPFLIRP